MSKPRIPNKELPRCSIAMLMDRGHFTYWSYHTVRGLLARQFPGRVRAKLLFQVGMHEGVPWVTIYRSLNERGGAGSYYATLEDATSVIASAPMLPITKRYKNTMIDHAVLDPELVAYVLLTL